MAHLDKATLPPPKRDESVIVTARMPVSLVKRLDKLAARQDRTRSKLIEIAARHYLEEATAA